MTLYSSHLAHGITVQTPHEDVDITARQAAAWDSLTPAEKDAALNPTIPEPPCECGHPGFEHWNGTAGTDCDICDCPAYKGATK